MCALEESENTPSSRKVRMPLHTIGEHEAVAVEVIRAMGGIAHHILPERNSDCCHANGSSVSRSALDIDSARHWCSPWMSAFELLAEIRNEEPERLENEVVLLCGLRFRKSRLHLVNYGCRDMVFDQVKSDSWSHGRVW